MKTTTAQQIEAAEDAYTGYLRANYGPLWGQDEQAEADRLEDALRAAYEQAGTPDDDRLAGFES